MPFRTLKILLVDDSPSDAALLQESLAEAGAGRFEFTQAATWADALAALQHGPFDILLLDLSLPDTHGPETYQRARAAAPLLPIIILSGLADEALSLEAVRHGIQDYLVKGQFDGRQTARAIRYAIERKRAEEALKTFEAELARQVKERTAQLQEMVAELQHVSYSMMHDMRAPLRAITGYAGLLEQACADCQRQQSREFFDRISAATRRIDLQITDALQYTKAVLQEVPLQPVDLARLLPELLEAYPSLRPDKADIRIEGTLPVVLGNESLLTQCFSNLLANAVKFVKPGQHPTVRIWAEPSTLNSQPSTRPASSHSCSLTNSLIHNSPSVPNPQPSTPAEARGGEESRTTPQDPSHHSITPPLQSDQSYPSCRSDIQHPASSIRIFIQDNGIGIPKSAQSRLFGMFQRMTTQYEGSGMGLAIVRKLVQRLGGQVGVQSEEGQGSRFWVELPLPPPPAAQL